MTTETPGRALYQRISQLQSNPWSAFSQVVIRRLFLVSDPSQFLRSAVCYCCSSSGGRNESR
jgi:hypothetical protein